MNTEETRKRIAGIAVMKFFNCQPIGEVLESALSEYGAELEAKRCEHCGSNRIYSGPPDCPRCGAPNCCEICCQMDTLRTELAEMKAKLEETEAELKDEQKIQDSFRDDMFKAQDELTKTKSRLAEVEFELNTLKGEHSPGK